MTPGNEAAVRRAVAALEPETRPQAQVRAHARESSVPSALPLHPAAAPGDDALSPSEAALSRALNAFGHIAHGHSLLRLDPPSAAGVWAGHRKAAEHWNAPLARGLRLGYGLLHTGAVIPVYVVLWATSTPAGLVVTAALLAAAAIWL